LVLAALLLCPIHQTVRPKFFELCNVTGFVATDGSNPYIAFFNRSWQGGFHTFMPPSAGGPFSVSQRLTKYCLKNMTFFA
jgi:hypothetical protein